MKRFHTFLDSLKDKVAKDQVKHASSAMAEELFYDLYRDRRRIYKVNFFRGIFFGVGSALGGTLVLALIVWLLSLFVNFPVIGDTFRDAQDNLEQRTNKVEAQ